MSKDENIHPHGYWLMADKKYRPDSRLARAIAAFGKSVDAVDILDIGCGNGAYTLYLRTAGFEVDGYDGNPHTMEITGGECGVRDFSEPVFLRPRSIFLCLEVAEHIPIEKECVFTDNIFKSIPDYVILSWAIPGQGGLGHVNCRTNEYVIDLASSYGYALLSDPTNELRRQSKIKWFKKSLMVFGR